MSAVGDVMRTRIDELNVLEEKGLEKIKEITTELAPIRHERKALEKSMTALESAMNGGVHATGQEVSYEDIEKTVNEAGRRVLATDVASILGVDARRVARKLKKLADDGTIGGSKEDGYIAVTAAA